MHSYKILLVWTVVFFAPPVWADVDLSYSISSRNVYVLDGSVSEKIGMGREIFGGELKGAGRAGRVAPYGLEANYITNRSHPVAVVFKTRAAPWAIQPTPTSDSVDGWDFQIQPALRFNAFEYESIAFRFEPGLTLRYFHSSNQDVVPNSNVAGLYLLLAAQSKGWLGEIETSPLALSFGSHGRWGTQRDSNLLRVRVERAVNAFETLGVFLEYHHLHRTFTGSQYGASTSLFVSDLAMNLGVRYSL